MEMTLTTTAAASLPLEPSTFDDAVARYLVRLEADGRAAGTIRAYARDLATVAGVLGRRFPALPLAAITPAVLDEVLADADVTTTRDGRPRSPASTQRLKAAVRSFFTWTEAMEWTASNPARLVRIRKVARKPPRFLTAKETIRLQKELRDRSSVTARRDRVMIELLLSTGLRRQELVDLDLDDVDLDAKHLRIRRAKGGKAQVKFLPGEMRVLLRSYLKERRRQDSVSPALFLSNRDRRITARQVAHRVEHWIGRAGIEKRLSPHGLRHTFATRVLSRTGNLRLVQRALGHESTATTAIYAHVVDEEMEEALENL
jgi:integrase/recombinase XerC